MTLTYVLPPKSRTYFEKISSLGWLVRSGGTEFYIPFPDGPVLDLSPFVSFSYYPEPFIVQPPTFSKDSIEDVLCHFSLERTNASKGDALESSGHTMVINPIL